VAKSIAGIGKQISDICGWRFTQRMKKWEKEKEWRSYEEDK